MKYFVKLVGKAFGPLEEDKIIDMYHAGRLKDPVEISRDKRTWELIDVILPQSNPNSPPPIPTSFDPEPDVDLMPTASEITQEYIDPNAPIWFYSFNGSQGFGPVTKSALKTMMQCGMLKSNSLVWRQGENSRPLSAVPELSDVFSAGQTQSSFAGAGGNSAPAFSPPSGNPFQSGAFSTRPVSNDSRSNSNTNMFDLLGDLNFGANGSGQSRASNSSQVGRVSRLNYILLALLLGQYGAHNFYAKRMDIAIVQLFIGLTNLVGFVIILFVSLATDGEGSFLFSIPTLIGSGLQIWAIVDMCTITHDGTGKRMY